MKTTERAEEDNISLFLPDNTSSSSRKKNYAVLLGSVRTECCRRCFSSGNKMSAMQITFASFLVYSVGRSLVLIKYILSNLSICLSFCYFRSVWRIYIRKVGSTCQPSCAWEYEINSRRTFQI